MDKFALGRGDRIGNYEIVKRLGAGGMAEVYLAQQTELINVKKLVVVKRILPELASRREYVHMFLDEARIAAILQHPNIVQMFQVGSYDGLYYMALEHLHGVELRSLLIATLQRGSRMPLEVALHVAIGLASALHYAHERVDLDGKPLHIVHRDVTPHNLFVTYDGTVKLLDFGVAQASNRTNRTRDGVLKGKLSYMSPEQCRGESIDRRSDIFAIGILLFELTLCRRLFFGNSDFEIAKKVVELPITRPTEIWPEYPPELEAIVMRCLERDRSRRFQTAEEVQIALETFARNAGLMISSAKARDYMHSVFGSRSASWRDDAPLTPQPGSPAAMPPVPSAAAAYALCDDMLFPDAVEQPSADAIEIIEVAPTKPEQKPVVTDERNKRRRRVAYTIATGAAMTMMMSAVALGLVAMRPHRHAPRPVAMVTTTEPTASASTANPVRPSSGDANLEPEMLPPPTTTSTTTVAHGRRIGKSTRVRATAVASTSNPSLGRLTLSSELPVEVTINGVVRGVTPIDVELPPGQHTVRVRNTGYSINRTMAISVVPQRATQRHLQFDTIDL